MRKIIILFCLLAPCHSQDLGIFDPFNWNEPKIDYEVADENKSVATLLDEAYLLESRGSPLDSRTKLLLALKKEPNNIEVNIRLSDYYSIHVNHYKLALKYARKAEQLLIQSYSNPPYSSPQIQEVHSGILMRIADGQNNIDNYESALKTYQYYESLGYDKEKIAASKAWILMKLKRIDEAIEVSTAGAQSLMYGSYSLNVLAILKSMTGKREESLSIFKTALDRELSLGTYGNPATPLNNSGEVLREIFREEEAKTSWLKALRLPDGCDHILPSLNLMTVNLDRLNLSAAKDAIDGFSSCIAQFPLRNGEEHKALLSLAQARIRYYQGKIDEALKLLNEGLNKNQWFGKIGTSSNDLKLALYLTYSLTIDAQINRLNLHIEKTFTDKLRKYKETIQLKIKSWWFNRQGIQLAIDKLNNFEDLYIRNSDSQIDYPALVLNLTSMSEQNLKNKIQQLINRDDRATSKLYYNSFLANSLTEDDLDSLISSCRVYDAELKLYLIVVKLKRFGSNPTLESELYKLNPASLANNGLKLSVNYQVKNSKLHGFLESGFNLDNSIKSEYTIIENNSELVLMKGNSKVKFIRFTKSLEDDVNGFYQIVFSQEI